MLPIQTKVNTHKITHTNGDNQCTHAQEVNTQSHLTLCIILKARESVTLQRLPKWNTLIVSRSQTLSSIAQHHRGKGLIVFPGDDVSFPLGLGEMINVNRRFARVCARAMALQLALESDLRTAKLRGGMGTTVYRRNSCLRLRSSYLDKMSLALYPCQQCLENSSVIYGLLPTIFNRLKGHTLFATAFVTADNYNINILHLTSTWKEVLEVHW